ncbi:glycerophosphodiester phosphodiesterase family protein [soil metagenome]
MKIIGHRGAKGLAPENTKASFKAALKAGVDLIELDIRTSADGRLIVHHDPAIGKLGIATHTFAELKNEKADLLTLKEALDVIQSTIPVIIEIKKGSDMEVVIKKLKETNMPASTLIASFYMPALRAVKTAFPDIELIVNEKWSGVRGSYRCRKLGTKFITMNERWLWGGFIRSMSRSGYKLSAYPLNNVKKARRYERYGLYGGVTDYPDRFTA